jgi:hypothetical protein
MHVEILRNVMINGELAAAGSLLELNVADANLLIGTGKAKVVDAPAPPASEEPNPQEAPAPRSRRSKSTTSPQE